MTKKIEPCKVCSKPTKVECSHLQCPNRKRVTAQLSSGSSRNVRVEGTFRRVPIHRGGD